MRIGNLIRLKEEYSSVSVNGEDRAVFLILSQNTSEEQKLYGAYFKILDKHDTIINLPLNSVFAYEIVQ